MEFDIVKNARHVGSSFGRSELLRVGEAVKKILITVCVLDHERWLPLHGQNHWLSGFGDPGNEFLVISQEVGDRENLAQVEHDFPRRESNFYLIPEIARWKCRYGLEVTCRSCIWSRDVAPPGNIEALC